MYVNYIFYISILEESSVETEMKSAEKKGKL